MEICDFAFHQPTTLAQACELGREHGSAARFLAGGTELLADLKQQRDATQHVIELNSIPGLNEINADEKHLRIGAAASLNDIAESPGVVSNFPALSEAIMTMAAVQIRNRGTMGGNFCGAVPSADTPPICIAYGALARIAGVDGDRTVSAEEFFVGPRETVLQHGELLAEVLLPIPPKQSGASYQRFAMRRATALAVAGVAARIDLSGKGIENARVALGAVAPVPLLVEKCGEMLAGSSPSEKLFSSVAEIAAGEARPITDLRGGEVFRRDLVQVLTMRALSEATARAQGNK